MEDPGNHDSVHFRSCGSCSSSHSRQGSLQRTQGWNTAAQLSHVSRGGADVTSIKINICDSSPPLHCCVLNGQKTTMTSWQTQEMTVKYIPSYPPVMCFCSLAGQKTVTFKNSKHGQHVHKGGRTWIQVWQSELQAVLTLIQQPYPSKTSQVW